MLNERNAYGAVVMFESFNKLVRGIVSDVKKDGRFRVMEFSDSGRFNGVAYINASEIVEVVSEGNDSVQTKLAVQMKEERYLDSCR